MKKRHIKLLFLNFWPGFLQTDNYFFNLLKEEFNIEISSDPDYLFYSVFGNDHLKYKCKKIFYTGENLLPNFNECDYAFSFEPTEGNNYRLPHYLLYDGYYELVNKSVNNLLINRKFCNFVVSNSACKERNDFFLKLSKYKKIDSAGRHLNNLGYLFQSEYKFSIVYENNAYRKEYSTYITEKPFEAMVSNSIPIYRGGSKINEDFNTKSFINYHDFKNDNEMIDYIIYLDKNDDKYLEILKQPWFVNNTIPENMKLENIKTFLFKIFE